MSEGGKAVVTESGRLEWDHVCGDLIWKGNMPHPKDFKKRDSNEQVACSSLF
jgi:hypothetical protein